MFFSILVWPYKKQDSTKNCPTNHPKKCPTNGPTNCQSTKGICNFFPNALAPAWSPRQAHRTPDVHQADTGWQIFSDTWSSTWLCKGFESALNKLKKIQGCNQWWADKAPALHRFLDKLNQSQSWGQIGFASPKTFRDYAHETWEWTFKFDFDLLWKAMLAQQNHNLQVQCQFWKLDVPYSTQTAS